MSLRKPVVAIVFAMALGPGLSLGMSEVASARGGFAGGHFAGGHFAGAHFAGAHFGGFPGARGFARPGFRQPAFFPAHHFAQFHHFRRHRNLTFFGVGLGLGYASDTCWQWLPTRYGWQWVWACGPYYY
jgi:hypothetical protein